MQIALCVFGSRYSHRPRQHHGCCSDGCHPFFQLPCQFFWQWFFKHVFHLWCVPPFFRMRQSIFNKKSIASHGTRISLTHSDVECHKILLKEYTQVLHCSLLWLLLHTRSVPDQYMKTQYKQMPVPLSLQPQMVHSIM